MQSIELVTPRGNSLDCSKNFTTEAAKRWALNLPTPLVTSRTACIACQRTELRDIYYGYQTQHVMNHKHKQRKYQHAQLLHSIHSIQASVFPSTSFNGTRPFVWNNFPLMLIRKLKPFCFKKGNSAKASANLATMCGSIGGIGMAARARFWFKLSNSMHVQIIYMHGGKIWKKIGR